MYGRWLRAAFLILAATGCLTAARADDQMAIVTGPKTGTYISFGRDIAAAAEQAGVQLQVKSSDGSIDNIRRINSNENAALGIVQSDVLGFMARSRNPETMRMAEHLRMILPLYREEVHVLARKGIQSFAELENKKVVIGEDGSGHMLTSINLFAMTGVTPSELIKKPPPDGVLDLLDGKADAVIFVGGKPVKLFKNLETLQADNNPQYQTLLNSVHFLPLKEPRMLEEYQVAEITHRDYSFVRQPVPTIAVMAVLVDYDFSGDGKKHKDRCRDVALIADSIRKNLKTLQAKGHPKWKEVRLDAVLPIWKKDNCVWPRDHLKPPPAGAHKAKGLNNDLIDVIRQKP